MKRCILTDKRAIALIISFAMLASTFYVGPVFAAEDTEDSGDTPGIEYTEPEEELLPEDMDETVTVEDTEEASDTEEVPLIEEEEAPAENLETEEAASANEPEKTPEPAVEEITGTPGEMTEEDSVEAAASTTKREPAIRVVVLLDSYHRMLLKPDAFGNYTFDSGMAKVRTTRSVRILISNPAECELAYSYQDVASNTGGQFLEASLVGHTINDTRRLSIVKGAVEEAGGEMHEAEPVLNAAGSGVKAAGKVTSKDVQVTEIKLRIYGNGQAVIYFKSRSGKHFNSRQGKITIKQRRRTYVLDRNESVRSKSVTPKPIYKRYYVKYYKTEKVGGKKKKVAAYIKKYNRFEIKRQSGVSLSGYKAVQGGNSDGTYFYTAMGKQGSKNYVKIVKTNLATKEVVKVSKDLKLDHANDITYDPVNKRLVVTHNSVHKKRVSFVDPKTLKVTGYKDIWIPSSLKGATDDLLKGIKGFASVTYMRTGKYKGNYIAVISGIHNFLVLDKWFRPIEYISVSKRYSNNYVYYQGADNIDGMLYVAVFPKKKKGKNMICIYDMDGEFKGKISLIKGYEMENIFHKGDTIYMTMYTKRLEYWYTKETVTKKEKVKENKYKTVTETYYTKHYGYIKRSYIYKMKKVTL